MIGILASSITAAVAGAEAPGGGGGIGDPHRKWRILVYAVKGPDPGWDPREVEFMDIFASRYFPSSTTTIIYSSVYPSDPWVRAFDGFISTRAATDFSGTWPQWMGLDFGPGNAVYIDKIAVTLGEGAGRGLKDFDIQFADDDGVWVTSKEYRGVPDWGSTERRVFLTDDVAAELPPADPHRYWRVQCDRLNGDSGWDITELALFGNTGPRYTDGTVTASSTYPGFNPQKLLDFSGYASRWASDFSGYLPQTLTVDFGAGNEKVVKALSISQGEAISRMALAGHLAYSDDGVNFFRYRGFSFAAVTNPQMYFDERS